MVGLSNHTNLSLIEATFSIHVVFNRTIGPSMFEGEALGLNAMYATQSIRVPKPYKVVCRFIYSTIAIFEIPWCVI